MRRFTNLTIHCFAISVILTSMASAQPARCNLAQNTTLAGFPSPLDSDRGWGGGSDKWQLIDGLTRYPSWPGGLAFCGGSCPNLWCGESCGPRQITIDFGAMKTVAEIVVWHHGWNHTPEFAEVQFFDGAAWRPLAATRSIDLLDSGWSVPDYYRFDAVETTKVRFTHNNCGRAIDAGCMEHGWVYEIQVFGCAADFTCDGGVTIEDLLLFLSSFHVGDLRSDIDNGSGSGTPDGGVTIDDLLFFLMQFEKGC